MALRKYRRVGMALIEKCGEWMTEDPQQISLAVILLYVRT